ncbi:MAG: Panacea domain-containing protein [Melioribacteraceae bacterium]|nr:Panacea domain-containing protein [Melioribacteraceae bacterium]
MKVRFDFKSEKGMAFLESLLYKVGGKYNYMALLKLAFFADRYHIRNYARPVSGDVYYAMKLGPVPSALKDIIDIQTFYGEDIISTSQYDIKLKSENIDADQLSQSDIEAIDFAVKEFGVIGKSHYAIANLTHAYPEWDKYKEKFVNNSNSREDMDYLDFLQNAKPNHEEFRKLQFRDPFIPLTETERQDLTDEIKEVAQLYNA